MNFVSVCLRRHLHCRRKGEKDALFILVVFCVGFTFAQHIYKSILAPIPPVLVFLVQSPTKYDVFATLCMMCSCTRYEITIQMLGFSFTAVDLVWLVGFRLLIKFSTEQNNARVDIWHYNQYIQSLWENFFNSKGGRTHSTSKSTNSASFEIDSKRAKLCSTHTHNVDLHFHVSNFVWFIFNLTVTVRLQWRIFCFFFVLAELGENSMTEKMVEKRETHKKCFLGFAVVAESPSKCVCEFSSCIQPLRHIKMASYG